jgi:general secretion pathway protein A
LISERTFESCTWNSTVLRLNLAHKRPLLIIDEAQNLSLEALEEIRLLSNFETDTEKLLQIVLVGQPELRAKLQQSELRQLAQRISVSHHLSPINQEEIQGYIQHRLLVAGGQQTQLFTPQAVEQICQFSQGIPRLINVICDAALLAGYVEEEPQLNEEHIAMAVSHLGLQQATGNNEGQGQFLSAEQAPWSKTVRQLQDVCRLMEELYEKYTAQQGEVVANVERLSWLENRLTALEACLTRKLAELETRARQF